MELAALFSRLGLRLLRLIAAALMTVLLAYGSYCLWDTAMVWQGAFPGAALLQYKPTVGEDAAPTLAELQKLNHDVFGWLTVEGTHIDYPLVQGTDNMSYVNHDVYGAFALSGAIFLDSRNARTCTESYTLLYGHHMDNGAMFGDVARFTDADYFASHPAGTLVLPDASYSIAFFACVACDAADAVFYTPGALGTDGADRLLTAIGGSAAQYRSIGVQPGDQIIGLSTCAEGETNGRFILFGRLDPLAPQGEGT